MQFVISCDSTLPRALKRRAAAEARTEAAWWDAEITRIHEECERDPVERRRQRAALQAERDRRRAAGDVLPTVDALMRYAVAAEVDRRGWNRRWRPIPDGEASMAGRRWGVPLEDGRTGDKQGRLKCNLPDKLATTVRRATYWTSEPATAELQRWHQRFGDGPAPAEREAGLFGEALWRLGGRHPRREDMQRRTELRAKIVTTGDVLRAAAYAAAAGWHADAAEAGGGGER